MHFESVKSQYKAIILAWFKETHVREFYYGAGLQNTLNNLELFCQGINDNGHYTFEHWIAFDDQAVPFAFLMTSPVTGPYDPNDDYNKWYIEGKQTFTLDLLIGAKDCLGKGLADIMIREFILNQYANADFFIIDPELANSKAVHVYEKAGFQRVGEFTPAGNLKPHIMLRIEVEKLKSQVKTAAE